MEHISEKVAVNFTSAPRDFRLWVRTNSVFFLTNCRMKASLDCFWNCMLFCDLNSVVVQGVTIDDDHAEEHLLLSGSYKRHIDERGNVENSPLQSFKVGHALENNCSVSFYRC